MTCETRTSAFLGAQRHKHHQGENKVQDMQEAPVVYLTEGLFKYGGGGLA
jgi:hypothetical protein